jgi:hypothetical protein
VGDDAPGLSVARRGIRADRHGTFRVGLTREEREVLAALPAQARAAISGGSPSAARLFPPAHEDDERAEGDYRRLVGDGLVEGKLAALDALERTAHAERLTERELESWLGALESLRLLLGTELDITEESYGWFDADDPLAPQLALYHWLSWLQEEVVRALARTLPGVTTE